MSRTGPARCHTRPARRHTGIAGHACGAYRRAGGGALFAVLVLAAVALAGCAQQDEVFTPAGKQVTRFDGTFTWRDPVATNATGHAIPLPAADTPFSVERHVPMLGAEPNIGVTSSGTVFVSTFDQVQRSRDHGANWEQVFEFTTPNYPIMEDKFDTADPMLWVDPDTDRVYSNHMHPALTCTYLAWSDDEGESWMERPMACAVPQVDHQKVMTARPGPNGVVPALEPVYPNLVYICVNKLEFGTWCTVSYDGGITWAQDRQIVPRHVLCANINGHPAAFPDGTVAVPLGGFGGAQLCDRAPTVVITEDNGVTWEVRQCAPDYEQTEIDPDITVTPDGTAYMLFRHRDQQVYLMRSTDKFQTCDVFPVAPPGTSLNVFTAITSGKDGHVSMAYLGTMDPQGPGTTPSNATGGTRWHAYVTTSHDADAEDPTFITQQVTPREDPVQVGCVWLAGGTGGPHGCRNLLDFIDMVAGPDGRTYVAITDGCVPRNGCTADVHSIGYQSRDRQIALLVQDRGMGLQGELLEPLGIEHPRPFPEGTGPDG